MNTLTRITTILTFMLLGLKIFGFIDCSWWWVAAPFLIQIGIMGLVLMALVVTYVLIATFIGLYILFTDK